MTDQPFPDENVVPPPDVESDSESRLNSDNDGDSGVDEQAEGSEDDGEDLMDNLSGDYRPMPGLDRYDAEGLDDEVSGEVDFAQAQAARLRAERELDQRDRREGRSVGRRTRLPGALEEDVDQEDRRPSRRRRMDRAQASQMDDDDEEMPEIGIDLETQRGPTREWVSQPSVQKEVARQFQQFLLHFSDDNEDQIYVGRLAEMCSSNQQSLVVEYVHLSLGCPKIAMYVADCPRIILKILQDVAREVAQEQYRALYEQNATQSVHVRISQLAVDDSIRDIRQFHLSKLIRVSGVVTRRTGVFPQLQEVKYDCLKCGYILGPFYQNTETETKPGNCPQCQSKAPFEVNQVETIYRNYQKLTLQESPGTVPAGRLPRHKEVILLNDLIDIARPGEEIDVTGIYTNSYDASLNVKNGFPVFSTVIEANYVEKQENKFAVYKLTDEDKEDIHRLSRDPRIGERICKSIAPSIYGHANIKTGIALALFGGMEKASSSSHRLRGDINVLLLGDPGTAKSQFLKYTEKLATRAVYTTGKGASAVGLTAAVQKDAITKEWTLEGGALVLADKGVCLIDEFDKMNDQDRVSIHEAMEQQSISISKAGIVTSLQARCSVIAAANPIGGRYDSSRTFSENVELSDPILSRFDVLCVVKDVVDPVSDRRLASFVVNSHTRAHPDFLEGGPTGSAASAGVPAQSDPDVLPQDMLRKYITFAKQRRRPRLGANDYDKIADSYATLRKEAAVSQGMPIAVRHLESIVRMSEAHAAMHLREYVSDDDVDLAIRVMVESFVSTQKVSVQKALSRKLQRYLTAKRDYVELLMASLQALIREHLRYEDLASNAAANQDPALIYLPMHYLSDKAREYEIHDLHPLFDSPAFQTAGFTVANDGRHVLLPRSQ